MRKMTEKEFIVPVDDIGVDGAYFGYTELIRCKECKYNSNTEGNYVNCDIIPQMFGKSPDDNYCSWAEPKNAND